MEPNATPVLSQEAWSAAEICARDALPILIAKGMIENAIQLRRRAQEFNRRANGWRPDGGQVAAI